MHRHHDSGADGFGTRPQVIEFGRKTGKSHKLSGVQSEIQPLQSRATRRYFGTRTLPRPIEVGVGGAVSMGEKWGTLPLRPGSTPNVMQLYPIRRVAMSPCESVEASLRSSQSLYNGIYVEAAYVMRVTRNA